MKKDEMPDLGHFVPPIFGLDSRPGATERLGDAFPYEL